MMIDLEVGLPDSTEAKATSLALLRSPWPSNDEHEEAGFRGC